VSRRIRAPRSEVYRALLDAGAVQRWMVNELGWSMSLTKLADLVEHGATARPS
jgi:uncharacterized protein YndB with AHSA1/START domain